MRMLAFAVAGILIGAVAGLYAAALQNVDRVDRLERRVSCLERPHGESSIATTRINGHFVVTQPAHRTGCP